MFRIMVYRDLFEDAYYAACSTVLGKATILVVMAFASSCGSGPPASHSLCTTMTILQFSHLLE
ncbi:hypothetical protein BU24DRAFT_14289 [Aaosphaeria arxii CBS 175.79]|uniref:Uncharacterized protein n=1 Tax=Aaosphaeria arxii CBS 175.79 TaxID=1450172 RepID=A0A6A5Y707_9PLEO|nr:uncharacterized protein BU24DRAFT_14289 [Aaosphaeria arxii CBS 175.79]KAF2021066.1 hypothetical protein BU24DRAFT_14289 [Aaosphaeria arxii CBS 175.79]